MRSTTAGLASAYGQRLVELRERLTVERCVPLELRLDLERLRHAAECRPVYSGVTYAAVTPPSTTNVAPLTYDDSSLARKSAAFTISRGCARRPTGMCTSRRCAAAGSSPQMRRSSGVSTVPGQSALTRMPLSRELHGELAAHREHRALRRRVRDLRRRGTDHRRERRDVDHRAAATLEQVRDAVLAAEEDALRVDVLHALPRVDGRLEDAGVVGG